MIPRIIHYCWFGGKEKPSSVIRYIDNWKKILPDYEFIEWNESNFDIDNYIFAKEAYSVKKYAFVADVARLYALKHFGGIYFDTDVEVVKDFSSFLNQISFVSFEGKGNIGSAVIGAEPNSKFINDCLSYYGDRHFIFETGDYDMTPNTTIFRNILSPYNLRYDNTEQVVDGYLHVYPRTYFSAKLFETGKLEVTENTYCIHNFSMSWIPWYKRIYMTFKRIYNSIFRK